MSMFRWTLRALAPLGLLAACFLASPDMADAQAKVKVKLNISGFIGKKGQVMVSVYNSDDTFMEMDEAYKTIKKPITGKKVSITLELPPGVYAFGVLHDEDKNGKLKQWMWVGPPKEGVGASRNPDGIPKWKKCKMKIAKDMTIPIKMRYLGKDAGD